MKRPAVELLCYFFVVVAVSWAVALLLAPWLPFPFPKILRRVAVITAALLLYPFVARIQHRKFLDLGLAWSAAMRLQFWQGILIGAGLFTTLLLLLDGAHVIRFHCPEGREWSLLVAFIPVAVLIGLLEELFFRGVTLQSLMKDCGVVPAVMITSAFYAALHFVKYLDHPLRILPELIGLFLFGCVLALAYLRTRLLALSIGLHASLAYLAKMSRHFIDYLGREPAWFFGNNRWLTGALGWGLLAIASLIIAGVTRKRPKTAMPS